jgi:hypothetical protein
MKLKTLISKLQKFDIWVRRCLYDFRTHSIIDGLKCEVIKC